METGNTEKSLPRRLSFLDRYPMLWSFLTLLIGLGSGFLLPNGVETFNQRFAVRSTNLPIFSYSRQHYF
jgi:ACR3 family arsenite efflux pump ArsB